MAPGQVRAEKTKKHDPQGRRSASALLLCVSPRLASASLMTAACGCLMWCVGKSDHLVPIGRGDLVVFRSQVGSGNNVVHVKVVVIVLRETNKHHIR